MIADYWFWMWLILGPLIGAAIGQNKGPSRGGYEPKAWWIVASSAVLIAACGSPEDTLSDRRAASIVDEAFNQQDVGLLIGQVRFVERDPDISKGRESATELALYHAFAEKGFITITNERSLTSGFTGWANWNERFGSGVVAVATVFLTDPGRAAGEIEQAGEFQVLWLHVAEYNVEAIVANDPVTIGAEKLRVVQGTYTFEITEDLTGAWEKARGSAHVRERRFKALFKYDPFEKAWKLQTADVGKRTEDFPSDNVGKALRGLRQ